MCACRVHVCEEKKTCVAVARCDAESLSSALMHDSVSLRNALLYHAVSLNSLLLYHAVSLTRRRGWRAHLNTNTGRLAAIRDLGHDSWDAARRRHDAEVRAGL